MADTKVVGCNWIELPPKKHKMRKETGINHLSNECDKVIQLLMVEFVI